MNVYTSKYSRLPGSSYAEALSHARQEYNVIAHSTKRQPYVKSKYFNGNKVFLNVFWDHVMQKRLKERTRRLRFYRAALDRLAAGSDGFRAADFDRLTEIAPRPLGIGTYRFRQSRNSI